MKGLGRIWKKGRVGKGVKTASNDEKGGVAAGARMKCGHKKGWPGGYEAVGTVAAGSYCPAAAQSCQEQSPKLKAASRRSKTWGCKQ